MRLDLEDKRWLDVFVREELSRYDRDSARARLPAEVRAGMAGASDLAPSARVLVARSLRLRRLDPALNDTRAAFVEQVRGHLGLALDLALLHREPFVRAGRRAELAAFLAAAGGANGLALRVEAHEQGGASERDVERAFRTAGGTLLARFYPPGDPRGGLPLHPGQVAVYRRHLARVVMGFLRTGRLEEEALARHREYAVRELLLLAEALAGLLRAAGSADGPFEAIPPRQISRLGLPREAAREARRAVAAPRSAAELASAAPERLRPFLLEQLLLAQLRARLPGPEAARFVEAFANAGRLDAQAMVSAQVEAAAQHGDHQVWFDAIAEAGHPEWQRLADEWEKVADLMVERVAQAFTDNLEAVVTEVRETGQLGGLLAKATAGHRLTAEERRKVKTQLIDLAKAVPALAIFAAPGGMLLLPLLAKLLPFNVLPSAWERTSNRKGSRERRRPGSAR